MVCLDLLDQKSYLTNAVHTRLLTETASSQPQNQKNNTHMLFHWFNKQFLIYFALSFQFFILIVVVLVQCGDKGAFQVLVDNYVKEEEGTGVVHQAPYFGAVSELSWTFFHVVSSYYSHGYEDSAVYWKHSRPHWIKVFNLKYSNTFHLDHIIFIRVPCWWQLWLEALFALSHYYEQNIRSLQI